jgi:hypothetical protein
MNFITFQTTSAFDRETIEQKVDSFYGAGTYSNMGIAKQVIFHLDEGNKLIMRSLQQNQSCFSESGMYVDIASNHNGSGIIVNYVLDYLYNDFNDRLDVGKIADFKSNGEVQMTIIF